MTISDDPVALRDLAVSIATATGTAVMQALQLPRVSIDTKSSATDLVTEADRAAEAFIVGQLTAARPNDGIIGEEGTDRAGSSGVTWVIDPIDGTTNFVYGIPGFNVSIAAQVADETVAAAVVDPLHADVFAAARHSGATRNGVPISCTESDSLATALLATGFGYDAERRRRQAEVLTTVLPLVRDIRRVGAAAVDLCWVACGRVDGYYEKGLQHWDYAAGSLIASEAGARVGDLRDGQPSSEFTMAAAPALFEPLRDLLRRAGAEDV